MNRAIFDIAEAKFLSIINFLIRYPNLVHYLVFL